MEVRDGFSSLRGTWPNGGLEVKGSSLTESQAAEVSSFLTTFDPLFLACAIDMSLHTDSDLTIFKSRQADRIRDSVTAQHHPNLVGQFREMADDLQSLSNQLFVQVFLTWDLCDLVLRYAKQYYVMRSPSELGEFRWRVDAKDQTVTQAERLWSTLIFPLLFAQSLRDPYPEIAGADYSYMEPFRPDDDAINQVREFRPDMLAPGTARPPMGKSLFPTMHRYVG